MFDCSLIGEEGWAPALRDRARAAPVRPFTRIIKPSLAQKIAAYCEPFESPRRFNWIDCWRELVTHRSCFLVKQAIELRNL